MLKVQVTTQINGIKINKIEKINWSYWQRHIQQPTRKGMLRCIYSYQTDMKKKDGLSIWIFCISIQEESEGNILAL